MRFLISLCLLFVSAGVAHADEFDSGSTGALGDVVITNSQTIDLPPDGILHYASLTVSSGAVLKFRPNGRNTPVFVLATGDIVLEDGGVIDVSGEAQVNGVGGRGGPGGFAGGSHVDLSDPPSGGQGPGAGQPNGAGSGGNAGYGQGGGGALPGIAGQVYGSQLLLPLIGGSGGAGGTERGGGGGGGAILLASNTRIELGLGAAVRSRGGTGFGSYQYGSGGAVRVLAPVIAGVGTLDVVSAGGGNGRVRIDTLDMTDMNLQAQNGVVSIGTLMVAFLDVEPQIDIVGVGQTSIPLGYDGEFLVLLPSGAGPDQDVTLSFTDFSGIVYAKVALVPEIGDPIHYDFEVDMANAVGGVVTIDVPVSFPVNVPTVVTAWTYY